MTKKIVCFLLIVAFCIAVTDTIPMNDVYLFQYALFGLELCQS